MLLSAEVGTEKKNQMQPCPPEADSLETRATHRKHVAQHGISPGPVSAQLGGMGCKVLLKWEDE